MNEHDELRKKQWKSLLEIARDVDRALPAMFQEAEIEDFEQVIIWADVKLRAAKVLP